MTAAVAWWDILELFNLLVEVVIAIIFASLDDLVYTFKEIKLECIIEKCHLHAPFLPSCLSHSRTLKTYSCVPFQLKNN